MSTTARVGVDIVATDRSRAAFASAQNSMARLNSTLNQFKGTLAAFAGGNLLASFARSMVGINREVPAVKQAMDTLTNSWTLFGQKVGEAGLNQALINFANRMAAMVGGTDSLSQSIGGFMAGAVNVMSAVFEGIGRSIAFVYDNMGALGRLLAAIGMVAFGRSVLFVAGNLLLFYKSIAVTAKGLLAFSTIQRMGTAGFILIAGVVGYATDSLDDMRVMIDNVWSKVKGVFPEIGTVATGVLKDLGFNVDSLTESFRVNFDAINGAGNVVPPATEKLAKLGQAGKSAGAGMKEASFYMTDFADTVKPATESINEIGQALSSNFSSAFSSVIDGTKSVKSAFADMVKGIAGSLANSAISNFASAIFGGGGGGGGLFSSLFGGGLPSFAVGTSRVPRDMVAQIHKDEMVIPARQADAIRNGETGSSGAVITININAQGADSAVKAELANLKTSLPRIIKSVVAGEKRSNPGFAA